MKKQEQFDHLGGQIVELEVTVEQLMRQIAKAKHQQSKCGQYASCHICGAREFAESPRSIPDDWNSVFLWVREDPAEDYDVNLYFICSKHNAEAVEAESEKQASNSFNRD